MTSSPTPGLIPLNDCVLVELKQSYKNVSTREGKYDTRTEGIVVAIPEPHDKFYYVGQDDKKHYLPVDYNKKFLGKRIHFEEFKEGSRIKRGTKVYSFIKIDDIRGYEDEQTS